MDRVRVSAIQYFIRPVDSFERFAEQVASQLATAADYGSRLIVFPEYFTTQLLSLGDPRRPMPEQVRELAGHVSRFVELMSGLAREHDVYVVAGTIPHRGDADPADGPTDTDVIHNDSFVFGPGGDYGIQGKLHMTRFETEDWLVSPRDDLVVFDTEFGGLAVAVCYDVEFPEVARAAARADASILAVPSCTDDRRGFLRVRYCAHARAIENGMYVVHTGTAGGLPLIPHVHLNYSHAALLTPSDFAYPREGILAESEVNQESIVTGDFDLRALAEGRDFGTVLPLRDAERTRGLVLDPRRVSL